MTPIQAHTLADQRGYRPLPVYTSAAAYADGDRIFAIRQSLTPQKSRDPDEIAEQEIDHAF